MNELLHSELRQAIFADDADVQREATWLSPELVAAITAGWRATYSLLFDKPERPFVANTAIHHARSIRWHWAARHRMCRNERIVRDQLKASTLSETQQERVVRKWREKAIRHMADFPMWPRGHMKSTVARRVAVVDAVITLYYNLPGGYCLYVGGTDAKTNKHAISVAALLQAVRPHVPSLAEVRKEVEGGRTLGWRAEFFYTRAGYVFHFGSLQSGLAGGNIEDIRPTLLVLDDIDDRKLSPVQAQKNFELLTSEILPMGAIGTLTFWAQNLINRYSCMYRIYKGHVRVLTNRRPTKPIPAILDPVWDVQTINGIVRDVLVSGKPTWPYFGLKECQDEINRMGRPAFERECQHMVEQSTEGLMVHAYDDNVHPISLSEFESVFGERRMPKHWPKRWGNDWARTKTAHHANVAIWETVSPQHGPLPGMTFLFHPMSFKANTTPLDVAERVLSCLQEHVEQTTDRRLVTPAGPKEQRTWAELRRDELLRANALAHTKGDLERIEFERSILAEVIPKYSEPVLEAHNVQDGVNSHERDDIRKIYAVCYGLTCRGINPGKFGGVENLNRDYQVDYSVPHPFRPQQMGYTRRFVVVPDDTSQQPTRVRTLVNGREREVDVYPPAPYPDELAPDDLHDDKLFRYQMCNWRTVEAKVTETGEKIDEPLKMNDDFGNLQQFFAVAGELDNTPLTPAEEFKMLVESRAPDILTPDGELVVMTKADQQRLEVVKWGARQELEEKYDTDDPFELEDDDDGPKWWEGA